MIDPTKKKQIRENLVRAIRNADRSAERPDSPKDWAVADSELEIAWRVYNACVLVTDPDVKRLNAIRWLMGYVENGGGQTVRIYQDDATKSFSISATRTGHWWFDDSFRGVLDKLVREMESDPERFA